MDRHVSLAEALAAVGSAPPERLNDIYLAATGQQIRPPVADERPLLYTVTEAAQRLNVSRSTCWRIIRAGRLTKVEIYPGCERLRRADVEALAGGAP